MSGKEQVLVDAPASAALQLVNPSSSFFDIVSRLSYSLAHVLGFFDITARGPRAGLDVSPRIYRPQKESFAQSSGNKTQHSQRLHQSPGSLRRPLR